MGLNESGCIAHACWDAIPQHLPDVELGAFIVMPNHVHGLIGLRINNDTTGHAPSLQTAPLTRPGSLSATVGSYKSAVTRTIRSRGIDFAWQPRFHDHVVRNDACCLESASTFRKTRHSGLPIDTTSSRLRLCQQLVPTGHAPS
jgi:putative transposase